MRKSEVKRIYRILDHMEDCIVVASMDGRVIYGNRPLTEYFHVKNQYLKGKKIWDLFLDLKPGICLILESGHTFQQTTKFVCNKDETIEVGMSLQYYIFAGVGYLVVKVSNHPWNNQKTYHDILRTSMNMTHEGMIGFDLDFKVKIWNTMAEKRFGYQKKDMLGSGVCRLIPKDKLDEAHIIQEALRMGYSMEGIRTTRLHQNGHPISVCVSYAPYYDQNEKIAGYLANYQDQTELDEIRNRLEEYKVKSALALECSGFGIWEVDLFSKSIVFLNHMEQLLGYEEGTLGNTYDRWRRLVCPEDLQESVDFFWEDKEDTKEIEYEIRMWHQSGEYRWMRVKGKAFHNHVIGTMEDIHERKEIEQHLKENHQKMKYLMEAANTANEAKSSFLANMSHEIRTPLNGLLAASDLLMKKGPADLEQAKLFEMIYHSAESMEQIVKEVLHMAQAKSSEFEIREIPFLMADFVQSLYESLQRIANEKQLMAGIYMDPAIGGSYLGDRKQLVRILEHLISNAVKFTEAGSVFMKVNMGEKKGSIVEILFRIIDTGIGISKEQYPYIFDPFVQGDLTSEKKYPGMGLGLSIANELALAMKGQLCCESTNSGGSTFLLRVPLERIEF